MKFEKYYDNLMNKFGDRFISIRPKNGKPIEFPDGFGVLVIWLDNQDIYSMNLDGPKDDVMMFAGYDPTPEDSPFGRRKHGLVYVGKVGSYVRSPYGELGRMGAFGDLADFATPIRFSQSKEDDESIRYQLRLGPKFGSPEEQYEKRFQKEAYRVSKEYSEIRLDFFLFTGVLKYDFKYSPALLEAEMLTRYLFDVHKLPPVNKVL